MDRHSDEQSCASHNRVCRWLCRCGGAVSTALRRPLVWLMLLAVLPHLRYPPTDLRLDHFDDQKRFFREAEWLASGRGFPTTSHAPGYPLLLAAVLRISGSPDTTAQAFVAATRVVQIVMAVAACALVYAAVAPRSRTWATIAFVLLAALPGLHRAAWSPLSEGLSLFLASVAAYLLSVLFREGAARGAALPAAALGAVCAAMILTAPGMVCAAGPIGLLAAWRMRRSPRQLACLVAGGLLLVVPWQVHCHRREGRIVWTLYTLSKPPPEMVRWYQTWARSENDLGVFWNRGSLQTVPDAVFASPEERQELETAWRGAFGQKQPSPEAESRFALAAQRRIDADPWGYYVRLPAVRARRLWFERGDMGGVEWAVFRVATLAALLLAAAGALPGRPATPRVILAATLLYTALSAAWPGLGESRRNLPLYPLLLSTLAYAAQRHTSPKR